jgi:DNA-binding NarL/FixJ family response regulator
MISVLIDHEDSLLAAGITATLERSGDFRVMSARRDTAAAGVDSDQGADIVIADYDSGLRLVHSPHGRSAILVLTRYASESQIRFAIEHGISGYLLIGCSSNELLSALRALSRGRTVFSGPVAARLAASVRNRPLTRRELAVLSHVVKGCTDKDIGCRLAVSAGTVKSHMRSILAKLGVRRRSEAAAVARSRGLFPGMLA